MLFFALAVSLVTGTINGLATQVVLAVLGCVFTGVGVWSRYLSVTTIVFDMNLGIFWKGRGPAQPISNQVPRQNSVSLSKVHALQLISQYHPSESGRQRGRGTRSYFSYELILVLKNSARVSVVHHGGRQELLQDATTLSQSLRLPLWNGITDK